MQSQDASGPGDVTAAIGRDALDVFPFDSIQRWSFHVGRRLRAVERRHDLVRICGLREVARRIEQPRQQRRVHAQRKALQKPCGWTRAPPCNDQGAANCRSQSEWRDGA